MLIFIFVCCHCWCQLIVYVSLIFLLLLIASVHSVLVLLFWLLLRLPFLFVCFSTKKTLRFMCCCYCVSCCLFYSCHLCDGCLVSYEVFCSSVCSCCHLINYLALVVLCLLSIVSISFFAGLGLFSCWSSPGCATTFLVTKTWSALIFYPRFQKCQKYRCWTWEFGLWEPNSVKKP